LFSPIFLSGALSAQTVVLIAIAALACLLGVEIAAICILASKIVRARRQKMGLESSDSFRNYGMGVLLLSGAVGQTGYTVLIVLAILSVLAALVLVGMLVAIRVLGYDFISTKQPKSKPAKDESEEPVEEPVAEDTLAAEQEDQLQEAYDEPLEAVAEEDAAEEIFEESAAVALADRVAEEDVTVTEPAEEIEIEETVTEETSEDTVEALPMAVSEVTEPAPASGNDGQPYRVVEKVVTETVKEIYKETPQPAAEQQAATASGNDSVVEKLVDLLDFELRSRREIELAEANKQQTSEKSAIATFAAAVAADEDDDDDDDDLDESEEGAKDDAEDYDGEENDTEGDHFTGNERIIGFDEKTGCYIVAHYRKSFEAKLIQARPNIKQYYSELKNALLSYKGTKNRISWTADSFHNGRTPIAKINVKTRILELYLALDPDSLEGTVYRGKNVGNKKKYADTPFQYKLRTPRKFKWAMELVQRVCEEKGLSPIDIEKVDYEAQYPFDTTENLVERKLIKEYIREEKPASSFELDPDHVPEVPTEDETVIPANANFTWEFDNERMVEKEPDPIPEPEPQELPSEEPAPELAPVAQPAPAIVRETVKVTETRYTERYYSDKPIVEQEVIVSEPIEAEAEPVEEAVAEAPEEELVEAVEESLVTEESERSEESTDAQEPTVEDDALAVHEIVYADDDSYGADGEYAPVEMSDEEAIDEPAEQEPSVFIEDDEEPIFGDEFEELPYEEAPFEDAVAEEEAYEEAYEEVYEEEAYAEEPTEEVYYEESEEDAAYEEQGSEEGYETVYEDQPYREGYDDSYTAPPFAQTYAEDVDESASNEADDVNKSKFNPSVAVIDICSVEAAFRAGEVISLDTLKERNLVLTGVSVLKIYASGSLGKAFTVEAHQFTMDAIRAISDAHGDVIMVR